MIMFCIFQAQRLLLQDGSLANFTISSPSTLPTITLGLPANTRVKTNIFNPESLPLNFIFLKICEKKWPVGWGNHPSFQCKSTWVINLNKFGSVEAACHELLVDCVCVQADRELSSLKVGRVPVVTAGGSPVFLPLGREEQAGQLNPHLQPVIILEPSGLVHTPLLAGETHTHTLIHTPRPTAPQRRRSVVAVPLPVHF